LKAAPSGVPLLGDERCGWFATQLRSPLGFMKANHASLALAGLLTSCLVSQQRGEPLYPVNGPRPNESQVVQLGGYVRQVDGKEVKEGNVFELLPGCHIVATPARWGRVDSSSGGVMVDTGHQIFALVMKPGHKYLVEVVVEMMGGSTGSAVIRAVEDDDKGKRTGIFGPAGSSADLEKCKEAAASF
jgi:hypothetical protein